MRSGHVALSWLGIWILAGACSTTSPSGAPPNASEPAAATPTPSQGPASSVEPTPGGALLPVGAVWDAVDLPGTAGDWSAAGRSFTGVTFAGNRIVAVGNDGAAPMAALSDDAGMSWRGVSFPAEAKGESDSLSAVSATADVVVAVGTHGTGCKFAGVQLTSCSDREARIWRSGDGGDSWQPVKTAAFSNVGPDVSLVDVAAGPDGFVAVGNVSGPSKAGARAWTSPDGLQWTAAVAFQPSAGWLARVTDVFVAGSDVYVAGVDVSCGEWFDNGFWVISGHFSTSPLLWRLAGTVATPVDLSGAGLPPSTKVRCEGGSAPDGAGSAATAIGEAGGTPAVALAGTGVASLKDSAWARATLALASGAGATYAFAPGADRMVGLASDSLSGGTTIVGLASSDAGWATLAPPQLVPATPHARLGALVGNADLVVAVGSTFSGHLPAIWRSVAAPLPGPATCDPAPGANCQGTNLAGVDLSGRDLTGVDLRGADLSGADLSGAKLSHADLRGARMSDVNLAQADLSDAKLTEVNLAGVLDRGTAGDGLNLTGADLRGARLDLADGMILDRIQGDQLTIRVVGPVSVSMREASLRFASLSSWQRQNLIAVTADFTGADLRNLGVRDVNLAASTFAGADVGAGLATALWFAEGTPCPNGRKPVEMIGFQMWTCGLP